jgi:hypothetical protein
METGFDVFKVSGDLGYPLYTGGASFGPSAIEVFPHASAVVLRGSLAPVGVAKSVWRRSVLETAGVACSDMRTTDHLDAALAALTGIRFLRGDFSVVGTPGKVVLVLPIGRMPITRYARDDEAASGRRSGLHAVRRPPVEETGHACGCGCGAPVRRRYLPGHDAKHRSRLLAEMRAGSGPAADELQRLRWGQIPDAKRAIGRVPGWRFRSQLGTQRVTRLAHGPSAVCVTLTAETAGKAVRGQ